MSKYFIVGVAVITMMVAVVIGATLVTKREPGSPASTALRAPQSLSPTAPDVVEEPNDRDSRPLAEKAIFVDVASGTDGAEGTEGDPLRRPREAFERVEPCLLYTSPSPRDKRQSRMPSSA